MKIVTDVELVNQAIRDYNVYHYFEISDLPFFIAEYEKAEILVTPLEDTKWLQFLIKGTVSAYGLNDNGTSYTVSEEKNCYMLGDIEFATQCPPIFWAEALTPVTALCLPISTVRPILEKDAVFLLFIIHRLAEKIQMGAADRLSILPLEERLLQYMEHICEDRTLSHIGNAAAYLHCSRRQLQRLLKKLAESDALLKEKRGIYRLREKSQ